MKLNFRQATLADCDRCNELYKQTQDWSRHTLLMNLAMLLRDSEALQATVANQRKRLAELEPAQKKPTAGQRMLRRAGIIP